MIIHPSGLKALHSPLQNALVQCTLQGSPHPSTPMWSFLHPRIHWAPFISFYSHDSPFLALFNTSLSSAAERVFNCPRRAQRSRSVCRMDDSKLRVGTAGHTWHCAHDAACHLRGLGYGSREHWCELRLASRKPVIMAARSIRLRA